MVNRKFAIYYIFFMILNITVVSLLYNLVYYHSITSFRSKMQTTKSLDFKYLLVWTPIKTNPIRSMVKGQNTFIERRCSFVNCYVTSNRQLLKSVADFDVLLFHGRELLEEFPSLPQSRSPHQKYVYAMREPSANYPMCNQIFNDYINWTWTYKLNSDEYFGYLSIRDKEGQFIGPKEVMHWKKLEAMKPINDSLKAKLGTKKIAAAWFVSRCRTHSHRELIAGQLQTELSKYNMQVDIYGRCGTKECPRSKMEECLRKLETDYYFYLSFENSFADDYVTEKLLHALNHYAIPVVYGGANYSRFMPEGIYLTAHQSRIQELAKEMVDIINDKQRYYDFFKWHNHYSYHFDSENDSDQYCKFCALVNNKEKISRRSVYNNFRDWWNPPFIQCPT